MCRAVPEQKLVPAQSACRRSQSCSAQNRAKKRNISALRKTEQNSAKTLLCTKQSKTAQNFCSAQNRAKQRKISALHKTEQNSAKSKILLCFVQNRTEQRKKRIFRRAQNARKMRRFLHNSAKQRKTEQIFPRKNSAKQSEKKAKAHP